MNNQEEVQMSEKGYQAFLIAPDTWALHETEDGKRKEMSSTFYLLAGDRQGLLIDTGSGESGQNLREYAQTLTNRPVRMVANTGIRPDFTGRDRDFKCAFVAESVARSVKLPDFEGRVIPVKTGFQIDLGDRIIEVFSMNGYRKDCLAFLDRKERLLFTGECMVSTDEETCCKGGVLVSAGDDGVSLYHYMKNLASLLAVRTKYDLVCWGYGSDYPLDANVVEFTMNAVLHALERDGVSEIDPENAGLPEGQWHQTSYKYARIIFN